MYVPSKMPAAHFFSIPVDISLDIDCRYIKETGTRVARRPAHTLFPTALHGSSSTFLRSLVLPPPFPLSPLLIITPTKLRIIVTLDIQYRTLPTQRAILPAAAAAAAALFLLYEIPPVENGVLVLLYQVAQARVARINQLKGREAAFVLGPWIRARFEHHVDEGVAELALGFGFAVDPADGGVERCVALDARDGVAFKIFLVEEVVDNVVCVWEREREHKRSAFWGCLGDNVDWGQGREGQEIGHVQFPLDAAS